MTDPRQKLEAKYAAMTRENLETVLLSLSKMAITDPILVAETYALKELETRVDERYFLEFCEILENA